MKGFPNQIADLSKLARGLEVALGLLGSGANARDDGVFGQALVRAGVAGTGHRPVPVEEYIRSQLRKPTGGQSFRTAARGLRELYRLLGLADDSGPRLVVTSQGRRAASFAGAAMDEEQIAFWRRVIMNMTHSDRNGTSHPYQVLLRLVARKPGISRAKCALALEANDDSADELTRVLELADLSEEAIRRQIGVTKSNWDNAKKILPRFAEQLGDVIKSGQTFVLADAPGHPEAPAGARAGGRRAARPVPRAPRSSRGVTPDTIAQAGLADRDEPPPPPDLDPAALAAAIRARSLRLRRHNTLVRRLAALFAQAGAELYEDPFDILALYENHGVLVEAKTLDGTEADERDRVRAAVAQLLYYEAFVTEPVAGETEVRKVACFELSPSHEHMRWLNGLGIAVIWADGDSFDGDELAQEFLQGVVDLN